jgi:uncharacterized membrane protein YbhN (UPF0104 family)
MDPDEKNEPDGGEKKSPLGEWLVKILQVLVTIGLLWWLLHDPARRADMAESIARADVWWLLAAMISAGACEFFGIIRWQLFLKMLHLHVPLAETTRLFFIGAFFNQFLPGTTGGDVVRVLVGAVITVVAGVMVLYVVIWIKH